jgi:hypothetical protein
MAQRLNRDLRKQAGWTANGHVQRSEYLSLGKFQLSHSKMPHCSKMSPQGSTLWRWVNVTQRGQSLSGRRALSFGFGFVVLEIEPRTSCHARQGLYQLHHTPSPEQKPIYLSTYLSIHLSYLFSYPFIISVIYLPIYPSIISICPSIISICHLSIYLSIHSSYLSIIYLPTYLFIHHIYLSSIYHPYLSIYLSIYLPIYLTN